MKRYSWTIMGFALSSVLLLYTLISGVDLFEKFTGLLTSVEFLELDEFIIPTLIFSIFATYDKLRRAKLKQIESSEVKIYRSMLTASDHILKNFVNQMQVFKLTAEETPEFDPEVVKLFEQIKAETEGQLKALRELDKVSAKTIKKAININTSLL